MLLFEKLLLVENNMANKYKGADKNFIDLVSAIDPKSINTNFISLDDIKCSIQEVILKHGLFTNDLFKKYMNNAKTKLKDETVDCLNRIPEDCSNRNAITSDCILAAYGVNYDYYFYSMKSGKVLYYEYETKNIESLGTVEEMIKKDTSVFTMLKSTYGSTNESLAAVGAIALMTVMTYFIAKSVNSESKRKTQEVMDYINKIRTKGFSNNTNFTNKNSPKLYEYVERGIFTDFELKNFIKKHKAYYDGISKAALFEINAGGAGDATKLLSGATFICNMYNEDLWYGPNGKIYYVTTEDEENLNVDIPNVGSVKMGSRKLVLEEVAVSYEELMTHSIMYIYKCLYSIGAVK